jgi:NAD(P)-dependent dehydrogenase (short-subunit alcohol dehydrogenase family)
MGSMDAKVAVVTGGASGMGKATAQAFAEAGAKVVLADVQDEVKSVAEQLGDHAAATIVDVTDEGQVEAMFEFATERFGRVDAICNVAGLGSAGNPLATYPTEDFDREIAVNLRGVFFGLKHGIATMIAGGRGGTITNWSSVGGIKAIPLAAGYSASKAGVVQITQAAAQEYGREGIRVNAICPGPIRTPLSERVREDVPDLFEQVEAASPSGRVGEPEEVAAVALFLASDAASYISGVALNVDGGLTSSR